jgi:hypothetical protein
VNGPGVTSALKSWPSNPYRARRALPLAPATEERVGAALLAIIADERLTASVTVQWCSGAITHREVAGLRQLASQASDWKREKSHQPRH